MNPLPPIINTDLVCATLALILPYFFESDLLTLSVFILSEKLKCSRVGVVGLAKD